jgi:hypothetical protein
MDALLYFRVCNHEIKTLSPPQYVEEKITSGRLTQHSLSNIIFDESSVRIQLIDSSSVPVGDKLSEMKYDHDHYFDDADLNKYFFDIESSYYFDFGNIPVGVDIDSSLYTIEYGRVIKWLVRPPLTYKVIYLYQPNTLVSSFKTRGLCERCDGFGWYVDIADEAGYDSEVTGIDKVAQRIIKDLLTPLGANDLDTTYGSRLKTVVFDRSDTLSDEQLFLEVSDVISEVEQYYLNTQAGMLEMLSNDEILIRLFLNQSYRDESKLDTIIIELYVETRTNARTLRIPV